MGSTNVFISKPSKTAELAAAVQALHRRCTKKPLFDDPLSNTDYALVA